jgi:hypothetical protein
MGQLDEISQAIGGLQATVDGIEKYIHDKRHDDANVSAKIDGLSVQITKEVARMKAEIQVQLDAMDGRIAKLEAESNRDQGAKGLIAWFLQSPLIGWVVAAIMFFVAWAKGAHS